MKRLNNVTVAMMLLCGLTPAISQSAMEPEAVEAQPVSSGNEAKKERKLAVGQGAQSRPGVNPVVGVVARNLLDWCVVGGMATALAKSEQLPKQVVCDGVEGEGQVKAHQESGVKECALGVEGQEMSRLVAFIEDRVKIQDKVLNGLGYTMQPCMSAQAEGDSMHRFILKKKRDVQNKPAAPIEPLVAAIESAQVSKVMTRLAQDPACVHKNFGHDASPLLHAAQKGRTNVVRVLLDAGAAVNAVRKSDGATALLVACANGYASMVALLLEAKASVTVQDEHGRFPLWNAYAHFNQEIKLLLLAASADVNQRAYKGNTTLMRACEGNDERGVRLLLAAHADVNAQSDNGETPLKAAVEEEGLSIVELLLVSQANPNGTGENCQTPLIMATVSENRKIVQALLDAKADPTCIDDKQCTALDYASHPEICVMLEGAMRVALQQNAAAVQEVSEKKE